LPNMCCIPPGENLKISPEHIAKLDRVKLHLYRRNFGQKGFGRIRLNAYRTEWKWRRRVFGCEFVVSRAGAAYDARAGGASWKR
jgi:hypothetical protein